MSKQDAYQQLLHAMQGLVEGQRNWVCNLANASSLLWHMYRSLGSPSSSVNWAGFYVRDRNDRAQLILGPFHGKVACQTIKIGDGVCGTAAKEGRMLMLEDVEAFPGHIACDAESKSEIVAPIKVGEKVVGVVDIDCADKKGFDMVDQVGLQRLANLLSGCCDWEELL